MQKRKTNILLWNIVVAIVFVVSGCLKSHDAKPIPAEAYVSIMHLAPTAPSLDIFFNDEKVSTSAFAPGNVSSSYSSVDKGAFSIKLKKASADSVVATVPSLQYDSLRFYTIFIYNLQANGPAEAVRIEDNIEDLELGKPFYRFFHASPNVNAVDLYMDNLKIESGRMLADVTIDQSLNKFRGTAAGYHTLQIKLAGTDSIIATRTDVDLLSGNGYTFYLRGLSGGSGSSQLSLEILRAAN